jgi:hypothetical protein
LLGHVLLDWSDVLLDDWDGDLLDLVTERFTVNDSVESIVFIGGVVNNATVTIGINQGVLSLDGIPVAVFLLALDVSGMIVMD